MGNYASNILRNSQVIDGINKDYESKRGEATQSDLERYKIGLLMEISRSLATIADVLKQ